MTIVHVVVPFVGGLFTLRWAGFTVARASLRTEAVSDT